MTGRLLLLLTAVLLTFTTATLWLSRGAEKTESESIGEAAIGGDFTLTDQNGNAVRDADFRGRYMLVFFGFTHCPDICPTTLGTFTNVLEKLGDRKKEFAPILITVDPARDTPERLKSYLASFDPLITGLTGTDEQIQATAKAYKAYYSKVDPAAASEHSEHAGHAAHAGHGDAENYMVNHSSFVYLMGKDGAYITHFAYDAPEETILKTLEQKAP